MLKQTMSKEEKAEIRLQVCSKLDDCKECEIRQTNIETLGSRKAHAFCNSLCSHAKEIQELGQLLLLPSEPSKGFTISE